MGDWRRHEAAGTLIRGVDHIGLIAPQELESLGLYSDLGFRDCAQGVAVGYGVRCRFMRHSNVKLEIVSPDRAGSVVDGDLARRGPGLHHIAFEVDDLPAETDRLRKAGLTVIDPEPQPGALPDMEVCFLHLGRGSGLLIELVHYGDGAGGGTAMETKC